MNEPKFTIGCPQCGCTSIHACTGEPIIWTEEDEKRLDEALQKMFERKEEC